ncbi:MAG: UDP-glucose/GDP-mannose dehydrogenase family protein [Spartobacteria bacterium]|nr:UDP-glucose/GDP-mannose dehydrogenase family protein [Spartobacteria bacterium]
MTDTRHVGVIGLWHQGIVAAACLAERGYDVMATDINAETISRLNEGQSPIHEPGLDDLLQKGLASGRLHFSVDLADAVRGRNDIFFMYDTPVDEHDQSDLTCIYDAVRWIAPHMTHDTAMLITAQVPVGTCESIAAVIRETNPHIHFGVAYSPENLRLGMAIERFLKPPLPVYGADDEWTLNRVGDMLSVLDADWKRVSLKTAEMSKHALNAFLATTVTFGNELGNICDMEGVNAQEVAKVLRMEERVGPKAMLFPGLGFSGGTLARDMQTLRGIGDRHNLETRMLDGIWEANKHQNDFVLRKLKAVFGDLRNVHIAVLGLTYKPGTSTLRRSASLEIIHALVSEGAIVWAHDPKADRRELEQYTEFDFYEDPYEAVIDACAVVIITGWPEYRELDFERMKKAMENNVLIDCNNMLDGDALIRMGYRYLDVGRGRAC